MAYDNELKGALFKNTKKERPSQPDYNGECTIGGVVYRISGWIETAKNTGLVYLSLKFSEKKEGNKPSGKTGRSTIDDDSIPF